MTNAPGAVQTIAVELTGKDIGADVMTAASCIVAALNEAGFSIVVTPEEPHRSISEIERGVRSAPHGQVSADGVREELVPGRFVSRAANNPWRDGLVNRRVSSEDHSGNCDMKHDPLDSPCGTHYPPVGGGTRTTVTTAARHRLGAANHLADIVRDDVMRGLA